MSLAINAGYVSGIPYKKARKFGGALTPSLIVLHDTAGRLEKGNTVSWFTNKNCGVSAHFVVERDGSVTQMVPLDRRAYHAGQSEWNGRKFCNSFSIGIEIVNPGKLDANGRAWFGATGCKDIQPAETANHGSAYWLPYTDAQVRAVSDLCRAIVEEYPDVNEIVTHWMISHAGS